MAMSRRALLALALACRTRPGQAAPARFHLRAAPGERITVTSRSAPGAVTLPAARGRLIAELAFGADVAALVAFAADAGVNVACDLLAVIGADPTGLRLMALEILNWRGPNGAHLATRAAATPDGTRLLLVRDAARSERGGLLWRREGWTDLLSWQPGLAMSDAPLRARLPYSWQASLAESRSRVIAMLATPRIGLDEALLAAATRVVVPAAG